MADIKQICVERKQTGTCGKEFVVTDTQQKWFKEKGWELPRRCKECRDARKAQNP